MRAVIFLVGLIWLSAPAAGWAAYTKAQHDAFTGRICIQNFSKPKQPHQLPDGACGSPNAEIPAAALDMMKEQLWTVVMDPNAAPELSHLLIDADALDLKIFIVPPSISVRCPFQHVCITQVEINTAMSWVAWKEDDFQTLYIGISALAFNSGYTLSVHQTAALLDEFWQPSPTGSQKTYASGVMPHFEKIEAADATKMGSGLLALYAILAHDVAHYWQAQKGVYNKANADSGTRDSTSDCSGNLDSLKDSAFAAISWTDYAIDNEDEYHPPWTEAGIWGCASPKTAKPTVVATAVLNWMLKDPRIIAAKGGIQTWPSQTVVDFISMLYSANSSIPTALAATSPEEDFADSYTLLALYRAGLNRFCLTVPLPPTSAAPTPKPASYDVIATLFAKQAPFATKENWLVKWLNANLLQKTPYTLTSYAPPVRACGS
jgi:hypothetical protein